MDIRLASGVAIVVLSVAATGVAGQLQGNASEPLQEYEHRAQAYELFIQSLRLEDSGDVVRAIDLLSRAVELDPNAAAIPAAQASLYAQVGQTADAIRVAERALALDADYGEAHRVLGLIFATLSEQALEQRDGRGSSDAEMYRERALTVSCRRGTRWANHVHFGEAVRGDRSRRQGSGDARAVRSRSSRIC